MSIRWGVSPIAWANDDMPELGGDTPLESILRDIAEVGFDGVELGGKFPRDPGVLLPLLRGFGLDLVGGWYSGSLLLQDADAEIAALQPHLRLLEAMGSTVFVFAETSNAVHGARGTPMTATPRLAAGDWARFGARMTAVADHVQARGLKFAYHHHLGTVVALGGIDALATIAAHPRRIAHVHCKDIRGDRHRAARAAGRSFLDGVLAGMYTVPGDGDLDFAALMQALRGIGYSGWIVVEAEQDPALADPRAFAELGLRTLKARAAEAGLR